MLIPAQDLPSLDDRVHCFLAGACAYDPERKIFLRRSAGRRRTGRSARYWLSAPAQAPVFTAASDAEAIEKANRILSKHGT